jgi:hypothetical protein
MASAPTASSGRSAQRGRGPSRHADRVATGAARTDSRERISSGRPRRAHVTPTIGGQLLNPEPDRLVDDAPLGYFSRDHLIGSAGDDDALASPSHAMNQARPPIASHRLARLDDGRLELQLKRPWRDGTTAFVLTPHELIERLVALVPRPRSHLTRYFGVFAPAFAARAGAFTYEHLYYNGTCTLQETGTGDLTGMGGLFVLTDPEVIEMLGYAYSGGGTANAHITAVTDCPGEPRPTTTRSNGCRRSWACPAPAGRSRAHERSPPASAATLPARRSRPFRSRFRP